MECEAEVNLVAGEEGGTMFCFSQKKKKNHSLPGLLSTPSVPGIWQGAGVG